MSFLGERQRLSATIAKEWPDKKVKIKDKREKWKLKEGSLEMK